MVVFVIYVTGLFICFTCCSSQGFIVVSRFGVAFGKTPDTGIAPLEEEKLGL
jgi:hypothetical protein